MQLNAPGFAGSEERGDLLLDLARQYRDDVHGVPSRAMKRDEWRRQYERGLSEFRRTYPLRKPRTEPRGVWFWVGVAALPVFLGAFMAIGAVFGGGVAMVALAALVLVLWLWSGS